MVQRTTLRANQDAGIALTENLQANHGLRNGLPARTLSGSLQVTVLGFGASALGNLFERITDEAAYAAVDRAWEEGVRYFDTAPYYGYGLSEERLGHALRSRPRKQYVISTKVGRRIEFGVNRRSHDGFDVAGDRQAVFDYSRDGVLRSFEESLRRLRLDDVDVLFLHDLGARTHGVQHEAMLRLALEQALPAMMDIKAAGGCRAIGLGVNEVEICLEVLKHYDLDCVVLGGRYTLVDHGTASDLLDVARRKEVSIIAAAPYNSGLLADARRPGTMYDYRAVDPLTLARAQAIYDVLGELDVDAGAAALQFPLRHPGVASVLCGLRSVEEVSIASRRIRAMLPPETWTRLHEHQLVVEPAARS